jgi:hypothetical protein
MASWLSFSSPLDVELRLAGAEARKMVDVKPDAAAGSSSAAAAAKGAAAAERREKCPVYFDGESVQGTVRGAARRGAGRAGEARAALEVALGASAVPPSPSPPCTLDCDPGLAVRGKLGERRESAPRGLC